MKYKNICKSLVLIALSLLPYYRTKADWVRTGLSKDLLTSVETTPWGILTGEHDSRFWLTPTPQNALYFSSDLGQNWKSIGLDGRAVTDIKFYGGKIYAGTYYVKDGTDGLFVSDNLGETWKQIGPMFSTTNVDRDSETIYLGGQDHGLWVSFDEGGTWVQKIGESGYGPHIVSLVSFNYVTFVGTTDKTYRTTDKGRTWEEIPFLNNKTANYFTQINKSVFLVATSAAMYKSIDNGRTWTYVQSFGTYLAGSPVSYNGEIYAGKINPNIYDTYTVYKSSDYGITWTDTLLNVLSGKRIIDIAWTFSDPANLYAISLNNGLFKYEIPAKVPVKLPIFEIPWKEKSASELLDKITSFFDHKFPLLGYSYKKESNEEIDMTLNFYGESLGQPEMYYSSHNGFDYALPYGTEIIVPAGGIADYYYCSSCGNSIKITHPDGYQSVYMHLQKAGLVTTDQGKAVSTGDVIGKVGMTGNTNGPHLHFEVIKDGKFPDGLVDPYGWINPKSVDPWPLFSWQDTLGSHQGSISSYLWKDDILGISKLIIGSGVASLDNKTINWNSSSTNSKTVFLQNYFQPTITSEQKQLSYVPNTSIFIKAFDFLGNELTTFDYPVEIKISFSGSDLIGIIKDTLKIYFWNSDTKLWESLPTILDLVTNTASALTYHFSNFAILGEKEGGALPITTIHVSGTKEGSWYMDFPTITLTTSTESSPNTTFFTVGGESEWEEYKDPILINQNGIVNFQYRSMDNVGNIEETKNYVLQINTNSKPTKTVKVKNASFNITE